MQSPPILEAHALEIRYGKKTAIAHLDLEVPEGSAYALLGRNGAGKSSFLRCLMGMQRPARGTLRMFGQDVWRRHTSLMERIAYAPEHPVVPAAMASIDAARLIAKLRNTFDLESFRTRLDALQIDETTRFGELSRGQQSLVSLGLALATRAELLILDDPTLGVDAVARRAVFQELIEALSDWSPTLLIATHDLAGVETVVSHAGVLSAGRLMLDGDVDELRARFGRVALTAAQTWWLRHAQRRVWTEQQLAWGVEAVVESADWSDLPPKAELRALRLEEIFLATTSRHDLGESAKTQPQPTLSALGGQ